MSKSCEGCKHAPKGWREYSQLPTCDHPAVKEMMADRYKPGGIWQLYMYNRNDPCGPHRKLKEST